MFEETEISEVSEKSYQLTELLTKAIKLASQSAQFVAQIEHVIELENSEE